MDFTYRGKQFGSRRFEVCRNIQFLLRSALI